MLCRTVIIPIIVYFMIELSIMRIFPRYYKFRMINDHDYIFDYMDDYCYNNEICESYMNYRNRIDRKWMPQINVDKLNEKYDIKIERMKIKEIHPIQKQINKKAVEKLCNKMKENRFNHKNYILVSNDNIIIDGNHRWGAYECYGKEEIQVMKYNVSFNEIYDYTYNDKTSCYIGMYDETIYCNN